jgi:hypothetical protein
MLTSAAAQEITIRVSLPSGVEETELTFDQSRVSVADAKRWVQFSAQGRYTEPVGVGIVCKGGPTRKSLSRMKLDVARNENLIAELNAAKYPAELSEVVTYLKRLQLFWLWQGKQELAFLRTEDISALESEFDEVAPKAICKEVLNRIAAASNTVYACELTHHDWQNCVNSAGLKHIGEYPRVAWRSFLEAYGIRERIVGTVDD